MDRSENINANVPKIIAQFLPDSQDTDTVNIKIIRLSDNFTWDFDDDEFNVDVNVGDMTWVSDSYWKSQFTPNQPDTYLVIITNVTSDVSYSIIYTVEFSGDLGSETIQIDLEKDIVQIIPTSIITDEVEIKITRAADGYTWDFDDEEFNSDVNLGDMQWLGDSSWTNSFTPDEVGTYLVIINDNTLGLQYTKIFVVLAPTTWGDDLEIGVNSWVTSEEVETYFGTRFGAADYWDDLTDAQKKAATITAYRQLKNCPELDLPDDVNDNLKNAQMEQALFLAIHGDDALRRRGLQAQGVTAAGIVKEQYREAMTKCLLAPDAMPFLDAYIETDNGLYIADLDRNEEKKAGESL